MPLVSSCFNIRKMKYCIGKIYWFDPKISNNVIYFLEKIYDLENFNVTDFLKLRNFYYDLVLHNRRPQKVLRKNNWCLKQILPQKCNLRGQEKSFT